MLWESSDGAHTPSRSHDFAVQAATPDHFVSSGLTYGATANVGQPFSITVNAYGAAGNLLTSFSGPGVANDQTGSLTADPITFTNGVATVTGAVNSPSANDWINVSDGVHRASVSHDFAVLGPVDHFISSGLTYGDTATIGQPFTITIRAYDAAGNSVAYNGPGVATDQTGFMTTAPVTFTDGVATVTGSVNILSDDDWISVSDGIHIPSHSHDFAVVLAGF